MRSVWTCPGDATVYQLQSAIDWQCSAHDASLWLGTKLKGGVGYSPREVA